MKNFTLPALLLTLLLSACKPSGSIPYAELAAALTNINAIARLDVPATQIINSHDRTGANEDYNHFQGKTQDGQYILADLKGPGVVTRFWFTGINPDKKIRLYFDDENKPRFEFSWNELRTGMPPFDRAPVSIDEQNCWYSFLPVPFAKRLLITTEDAGYQYGRAPKMYYQINWHPVPDGQTVESLSPSIPSEVLNHASATWETFDFGLIPQSEEEIDLAAGQTAEVWSGPGPATIHAFSMTSPMNDPDVLRNVLLKIYWDGSPDPSVAVPLGDFFGSVWQRWRAESMYFGSAGDTFFCRFPMPFEKSARIVLENQSAQQLSLGFGIHTGKRIEGGYFHADWRRSGAGEVGRPHTVVKTAGQGRYVGCILSVVSMDRSFWVLESDESMYVDAEKTWQGTGLEDYFNSGWYYGNVFARPLQGLPNKAPFRAVQYRLHPFEPVLFDRSFEMEFERGPNHASRAAFESTAFYYLDTPQAADSHLDNRSAPVDELREQTLMTDLWNYERFGDLRGEAEYIEEYENKYSPSFAAVLELRRQACLYESGQITKEAFAEELAASTNTYAGALKMLYTEEDKALVQLYCNMHSDLYLDGKKILSASDARSPATVVVPLAKGRHVLAVSSAWQQYPSWTQVAVRDAEGYVIGTSGQWKHAINPSGDWSSLEYDDSSWEWLKNYSGRVKGPPEEPYIWVNPDPFVNTLSQASGLRPSALWTDKKGRVVYRKEFIVR
jgi:hypothetical protein